MWSLNISVTDGKVECECKSRKKASTPTTLKAIYNLSAKKVYKRFI